MKQPSVATQIRTTRGLIEPPGNDTSRAGKVIDPRYYLPFALVTALFFLWGVPNNLNDILIRQFMKSFEISRFQAGLIQSAFYLGYFCLALPASVLIRKAGFKAAILMGLTLFTIGALGFWPATLVGTYGAFLIALFVIAGGLSFLETASNTFISQLGTPETSERRLNLAQAFNPIGAISGALIGTRFILSGIENSPAKIAQMKAAHTYAAYLHDETLRVVRPYISLAVIAIVLGIVIALTRFPQTTADAGRDDRPDERKARQKTNAGRPLWKNPRFALAVFSQFCYVGAQVGTWSYFIQYAQAYGNDSEKGAGYLLALTLAAFAIGRFSGSALMKVVKPGLLMGAYCIINIALLIYAVTQPQHHGVWFVFATSFFMSIMFPTIFAMGLRDAGDSAKTGGSILVMAIIGGAIFTPLMGLLSETTHSVAAAYAIPLFCYVVVAIYAFMQRGAAVSTNTDGAVMAST